MNSLTSTSPRRLVFSALVSLFSLLRFTRIYLQCLLALEKFEAAIWVAFDCCPRLSLRLTRPPPRLFTLLSGIFLSSLCDARGIVSTLAGSPTGASTPFLDGLGGIATFNNPYGLSVNTNGDVFVADFSNNRIRQITSSGLVTTLAGSSASSPFLDGMGSAATFNGPIAVAVNTNGDVFVADWYNSRIRKITSLGLVTTFAGRYASSPFLDGQGSNATFFDPTDLAVNANGDVLVADTRNHRIRKITSTGFVTTLAGTALGNSDGASGQFYKPSGVAVDLSGNVFVSDTNNQRIRKVSTTGFVTTLAGRGSDISFGFRDGVSSMAKFNFPRGLWVDTTGRVLVADANNNRIRQITPAGLVTTLAGNSSGASSPFLDGGEFVSTFKSPQKVAVNANGDVFVADGSNNRIRQFTPAEFPTSQPSMQPSSQPSKHPSKPSRQPSNQPSSQPSKQPFSRPSSQPSASPTSQPSKQPTAQPMAQPSKQPYAQPSSHPSLPIERPTSQPSKQPQAQPSAQPLTEPSSRPSISPTRQPNSFPTLAPVLTPAPALTSLSPGAVAGIVVGVVVVVGGAGAGVAWLLQPLQKVFPAPLTSVSPANALA